MTEAEWFKEKLRLIEAGQRERDRAQAIIHHVLCGGTVEWGMFLKPNGEPDVEAMRLVGSQPDSNELVHCDCTRSQDLNTMFNCRRCGGTGWESKKQRIARLRREQDESPQSRKENE